MLEELQTTDEEEYLMAEKLAAAIHARHTLQASEYRELLTDREKGELVPDLVTFANANYIAHTLVISHKEEAKAILNELKYWENAGQLS